jgi:hypothetical protein
MDNDLFQCNAAIHRLYCVKGGPDNGAVHN